MLNCQRFSKWKVNKRGGPEVLNKVIWNYHLKSSEIYAHCWPLCAVHIPLGKSSSFKIGTPTKKDLSYVVAQTAGGYAVYMKGQLLK